MKYRFNVDLKLDRFKNTNLNKGKKQVQEHLAKRNQAILAPHEIIEKYYAGKIACARLDFPIYSNSETFSHIYIYHDKSGICPESSFHFYTENGDLLWTYPWNGEIEKYNMLACPFDDLAKEIDYVSIEVVDNNIEIYDYSKSLKLDGLKTTGMTKTTFSIDGQLIKSEKVSENSLIKK